MLWLQIVSHKRDTQISLGIANGTLLRSCYFRFSINVPLLSFLAGSTTWNGCSRTRVRKLLKSFQIERNYIKPNEHWTMRRIGCATYETPLRKDTCKRFYVRAWKWLIMICFLDSIVSFGSAAKLCKYNQ